MTAQLIMHFSGFGSAYGSGPGGNSSMMNAGGNGGGYGKHEQSEVKVCFLKGFTSNAFLRPSEIQSSIRSFRTQSHSP